MIKKTAIIGMGALGLLYADQITTGLQDKSAVTFVMDDDRAKRHEKDSYTINGEEKHFQVKRPGEVSPFDLVIVAVKYNELKSALDVMAPCVGEETIILSVMNGITSEEIIGERFGREKVLTTVAQGMDAMRDGTTLRYTKCGNLHIGQLPSDRPTNLREVVDFFTKASVPHIVEEDILYRLWFKFMLNVGINQTCMVFDTTYGVATDPSTKAYETMMGAMDEVRQMAERKGVTLTKEDMATCVKIEKTLDPEGYPSMSQDRYAGRRSEVDMFAGEVIRMGKAYGIPTPCNDFFLARVREIEAAY